MKFRYPLPATRYSQAGQLIIALLIITMIIGIVVPALIMLVQNEAKQTTKEIKQTRAFHLAEAAADRGMYKLNESQDIWYKATHGIPIEGYCGDVKYTDIDVGVYKIKFSSGPGEQQVTILGYGKDKTTDESRIVKIVCYRELPFGGKSVLNIWGALATGTANVQWGAIMSLTSYTIAGSVKGELWPRKFARGYIDPRYTSGPLPKYGSIVDEELAEWHCGYPVPDFPDIDFDAYATEAQKVISTNTAPSGGTPAGSSYYVGDKTFNGVIDYTKRTYYITGNCTLKDCHMEGVLICRGNFSNGGTDKGNDVIAQVPKNAWREYQEGTPKISPSDGTGPDTSAPNEYPGDLGYRDSGDGTATYNVGKTMFSGFIYIGSTWDVNGNPQIYGLTMVPKLNGFSGSGTPTLWYNYGINETVQVTTMNPLTKVSWGEARGSF